MAENNNLTNTTNQIKHSPKRNYLFGIGTIGRDMVYALTSMFLMYYITDVLELSVWAIGWVTFIMLILRVFDAVNDPFMGMLIDNTKSRFGRFKPWIAVGMVTSAIVTILLFHDYNVSEGKYLIIFAVLYLLWDVTYTAHDIGYWSMLPVLSENQKDREKIGSIARICADIGMFSVAAGIEPVSAALAENFGGEKQAYFIIAVAVSILMVICLAFMLLVVKEDRTLDANIDKTSAREIIKIIAHNDQLLWIIISMALFTIAYNTTISFGLYYFEYIFGDKSVYSIFTIILGISQLTAIALFPMISARMIRKKLYGIGIILVCFGYIVFFFAKTLLTVSIGGIFIFIGEGFIQILMLMFIADCVEYGEWKFGKRNDSITLSVQPFITKIGSAVAAGVVGLTVIVAGVKEANNAAEMTAEGTFIFKTAMLILPVILIIIGYFIYQKKFIVDEKKYAEIVADLEVQRKEKKN